MQIGEMKISFFYKKNFLAEVMLPLLDSLMF